jgi:hypothetical protein
MPDTTKAGHRPRPLYLDIAGGLEPGLIFRASRFVLPPEGEMETMLDSVELVQTGQLLASRGLLRLPSRLVWLERHVDGALTEAMGLLIWAKDDEGYLIECNRISREKAGSVVQSRWIEPYDLRISPVGVEPATPEEKLRDGARYSFVTDASVPGVDAERAHLMVMMTWIDLLALLVPLAAEGSAAHWPVDRPAQSRDGHGRKLMPVTRISPTIIRAATDRYRHDAAARPSGPPSRTVCLHEVRGFVRHLPSGKTTWVRPHRRGDPDKPGKIRSHYEIKP